MTTNPNRPSKCQPSDFMSPLLCHSPRWLFIPFSHSLIISHSLFGPLTPCFIKQTRAIKQELTHLLSSNHKPSCIDTPLSIPSHFLKWKMCLSCYLSSNCFCESCLSGLKIFTVALSPHSLSPILIICLYWAMFIKLKTCSKVCS